MRTRIKKFGFEIEGEFSREFSGEIAKYGVMKGDGSVSNCPERCQHLVTGEYNSYPILRTHKREAKNIFMKFQDAYKLKKYHFNKSAGFHIHVSFSPKLPPDIFSKSFNDFFHERLKTKYPNVIKKRQNNIYCRINTLEDGALDKLPRYSSINFQQAWLKHGTIEFRVFPANTPMMMYRYLLFTLRVINDFLKKENIHYALDVNMEKIIDTPRVRNIVAETSLKENEVIIIN